MCVTTKSTRWPVIFTVAVTAGANSPGIYKHKWDHLLVSAGHLCDLSVLFMRIQNLVTILENLSESHVCEERHDYDIRILTLHGNYVCANNLHIRDPNTETPVCRQHYSMKNHLYCCSLRNIRLVQEAVAPKVPSV